VADGGMMSEGNLAHLAKGGSGYIVGVPLRKSKEAEVDFPPWDGHGVKQPASG
jgi:hypothetical protein